MLVPRAWRFPSFGELVEKSRIGEICPIVWFAGGIIFAELINYQEWSISV